MVRAEDVAGPEWAEWYALSPQQRFQESEKLWKTYLALGGSLDPEPDTQSPFFDRAAGRGRCTWSQAWIAWRTARASSRAPISYVPQFSAASTAARSSARLYCVTSSGPKLIAVPPSGKSLIGAGTRCSCSRVRSRTASGLSTITAAPMRSA